MRSEPPHSAGPPARTYRGWSSPASPRARLAHIQAETSMLEERWLELHTEIETITGNG